MVKFLLILTFLVSLENPLIANESSKNLCVKRGIEVVLPFKFGISKIKNELKISQNIMKQELKAFKETFKRNFYGINLYETSGCSKARLTEYLDCLTETNGKDCRINYSQMRLVD